MTTPNLTPAGLRELAKVIEAIGDGYKTSVETHDDTATGEHRILIVVENPDFQEGNGNDPNLVIDPTRTTITLRALADERDVSAGGDAMQPIPISAAAHIAKSYGYDQVVIIARRVGESTEPHGEHVTTYGRGKTHCAVAARIGNFLKFKVMGWTDETVHEDQTARGKEIERLREAIATKDGAS